MRGAARYRVRNQEHNRNRECTRMDPPTPSLRRDPAAAGRNKDQPQIFADGDRELKHHPISLVFVTVRQSSGRSLRDLLVKYLFLPLYLCVRFYSRPFAFIRGSSLREFFLVLPFGQAGSLAAKTSMFSIAGGSANRSGA
jgi:hypothetical protein